jgi:hypothetical protein
MDSTFISDSHSTQIVRGTETFNRPSYCSIMERSASACSSGRGLRLS